MTAIYTGETFENSAGWRYRIFRDRRKWLWSRRAYATEIEATAALAICLERARVRFERRRERET